MSDRFFSYNGVEDLPHRQDTAFTPSGLQDYDFYLSWTPKQYAVIDHNNGPCKRYWDAIRTSEWAAAQNDVVELYNDERIQKVSDVLSASVLTSLASMLYSSAIDFEYTVFRGESDCNIRRPLL
jgi:hypothetical protein